MGTKIYLNLIFMLKKPWNSKSIESFKKISFILNDV